MSKKFLTKEGLDNVLAAVETRYGPLLTHNHDGKYLGLTATAADSDKLDGKHLSEIVPYMYYDTNSGTGGILIATDLLSGYSHMVLVEIKGNAYDKGIPIDSVLQFYNYVPDSSIIQYRAINNGKDIGPFSVFVHDGVVKIWLPRVGSFVTYFVTVRTFNSPACNHVTSITQSAMPTEGVSRLVTVTPSNAVRAQGTATQFIMGDGSLKPLTDITGSYYDKTTADGRFAVLSHTHANLYQPDDTRSVATKPNDYYRELKFTGMKLAENIGLTGQGYLVNGFGWRGWSNSTGGNAWEIFGGQDNNSDLWCRNGQTTEWNAWRKILDSGNYAATLDGRYYTEAEADGRFAMLGAPNNLVFGGNEVTMIPAGYDNVLFLNYRAAGGDTIGHISEYWMCDGNRGLAPVRAASFIVNGGLSSQFLKADGSLDSNAYFHAGNMGPGSGLNADMVDGYHAGMANGNAAVFAAFPAFGPLISQGYLDSDYSANGYPSNKYFKALVKWCADTYPNGGNLIGSATPGSAGLCMINLYAGKTAEGFPNYCSGVYLALDGVMSVFGTEQGVWKWNIGNWNGKANSAWDADKLGGRLPASYMRIEEMSTARDLDANYLTNLNTLYTTTGDIGSWSTAFTNFPTAKPIGSFFLITLREGAYKKQIYSAYKDNHLYVRRTSYLNGEHWGEWEKVAFTGDNVASATKLSDNGTYTAWGQTFFENGKPKNVSDSLTLFTGSPTTGGWAREVLAKDSAGNDLGGFGFLGLGNALKYAYIGNSHSAPWVAVTPAGNVGIGNNAPAYPLDVNGTARVNDSLIVAAAADAASVPLYGIYSQGGIVTNGNVIAQNGFVDTLLVTAQGMLFKLSNSMIMDTADGPEAGTQAVPFAKAYVKEIHLGGATFTYDEATDSVICDKTIASNKGVSSLVEES